MRLSWGARADALRVHRALGVLACDAGDHDLLASLPTSSLDLLVTSAMAQGLGAVVAEAMTELDIAVPDELTAHVENARFARAAWLDVIGRVDEEFSRRGIEWVALKGSVLSAMYRRPETRVFNDIDLLVNGADFGRTLDALEHIGATDINRNWGNYLQYGVAETPVWTPGIGIDLHWHVVGLARDRDSLNLDIASMLARRRWIAIDGIQVPSLDPADLLLHVALHAARSGATRLVWLRDLDALVRTEPPDWDLFVARARASGVAATVGQVLDRARHQLGASIPTNLPSRLCPSSLLRARRVIDARDLGSGLPKRFARRFPVMVSETTLTGSARSAVRLVRDRLTAEQRWGVGDADGPLYFDHPSGGDSARSDYLNYAANYRGGSGGGEGGRQQRAGGD